MKIVAVICATFAVAKRKPEKSSLEALAYKVQQTFFVQVKKHELGEQVNMKHACCESL